MRKNYTETEIKQIATLHLRELSGFLPQLGQEFLEKFYRVALTCAQMFLFVEKEKDQIVGFVSGITTPKGLYKKIIFKDIIGFSFIFLKYFLIHPGQSIKFIKILLYPGFSENTPELLSIAISKDYQMRGIGRKLFYQTAKEFQRRGYSHFKISVYEKLAANGFYKKMNCNKIQSFEFLGQQMNYYLYRIDKEKLRVLLLSYDSLYANPVFFPLLSCPYAEIVGLVLSGCVVYKKNLRESIWFFYRRHGWQYFFFKIADQLTYILTGIFRFTAPRVLPEVKKRNIAVVTTDDINSKSAHEILRSFAPDVIISYFNQVLTKDTLEIASICNLNVHPGYLPEFRGVASSFYARLKGKNYGGVTIHYMLPQLDSGDILSREKVLFQEDESLHHHNFRCCQRGGKLLVDVLEQISKGKFHLVKQQKGTYYSWPKEADAEQYIKMGYKLFNLTDIKLYFRK